MSAFSQQNTIFIDSTKAPFSIHTSDISIAPLEFSRDFQTNFLPEDAFKFLIFDQENLERNIFTIDLRNIGRKASNYDFESYRKAELNKYFDVVPDIIILNRFSRGNFSAKRN